MGVVIPTLNAAATLRRCLDGVLMALERWGTGQVTVVDNGSTDGTYETVSSVYGDRVRRVRALGVTVAGLRNLGARSTGGELLSFVDADCEVVPDYYHHAWTALQQSGAHATGSGYALPEQPHWIERAWHALHETTTVGPVPWLYGGNLVVLRPAFERTGGFDEKLISGEDVDFCERLRGHGFRIHQDPLVRAVHHGNPRSLAQFCRQQFWHGIGMWRTARGLDRPLLMTGAHGLLGVAALTWGVARVGSPLASLGLLALAQLPVPAATVVFRLARSRRLVSPIAGLVLYDLYYWCRFAALLFSPVASRFAGMVRRR